MSDTIKYIPLQQIKPHPDNRAVGGCTEDHACPGGCSWADKTKTLCSACADEEAEV